MGRIEEGGVFPDRLHERLLIFMNVVVGQCRSHHDRSNLSSANRVRNPIGARDIVKIDALRVKLLIKSHPIQNIWYDDPPTSKVDDIIASFIEALFACELVKRTALYAQSVRGAVMKRQIIKSWSSVSPFVVDNRDDSFDVALQHSLSAFIARWLLTLREFCVVLIDAHCITHI
jgi:hypothetical protein